MIPLIAFDNLIREGSILYFYHAHAIALGERFHQEVGGSEVVCSHQVTGGSASAQQQKSSLEGMVSFDSARTNISWSREPRGDQDVYVTYASIVIEHLNIKNMFVADQVVTRLKVEQVPGGHEPTVIVEGSHFDNLRIAGHPVEIEYAHEPLRFTILDRYNETPYTSGNRAVCSFVKKVYGVRYEAEAKTCGPVIKVPQFGTVYLGEAVISPEHFAVNMFRLEPESKAYGAIAGGSLIAHRGESSPCAFLDFGSKAVGRNDRYHQIKANYEFLIDQKYLKGLSSTENEELHRLETALDEMDAPYYEETLRKLRAISNKEDSHS